MSATHHVPDLSGERIELGDAGDAVSRAAYGLGVVGLVATGFLGSGGGEEGWRRAMLSYLQNYMFFLSIMLGALFFVLIQHLTRAGWSVVVRRFAEGFAANAPLMAVLVLPIVIPVFMGNDPFFVWTKAEAVAHDPLLQWKSPYLNSTFFLVRVAVYFTAWIGIGTWYFRTSVKQDETGDPKATERMQKWSGPFMYVFALTLSFCAIDLMMSLEPTWFSTMWGVYFFAGSALGFFATLPIVSAFVQRAGRLTSVITAEHYHDMGKFVFAFVVFWAYIAFSQYMLYWYANIPEETVWFLRRQTGGWTAWSWFLLLGHFIAPFMFLISRTPKRVPHLLGIGAAWILLMHWVDLYYIIMPHASPGAVPLSLVDLTAFVGLGGLFVGAFVTRMKSCALVPKRDPRLGESLSFENF